MNFQVGIRSCNSDCRSYQNGSRDRNIGRRLAKEKYE